MSIKICILACILLFPHFLSSQENNDLIVMKNGDRFTGEIKGLGSGMLSVKLKYVDGTIAVQWSEVAEVKSNRLFIIRTESGEVYTGRLSPSGACARLPVSLRVADSAQNEVMIDSKRVVKVDQASDTFWHRFNGSIDTGILYSKANQALQYNLDSQLTYRMPRWSSEASFNSDLASNADLPLSTRNQVDANVLHLAKWNNWFYGGSASFLQSSVQQIESQTTLGGGVGKFLKNNGNASIYILGGLAWQGISYDNNSSDQERQNTAVLFVQTKIRAFRFKKTNVEISASVLPAITDAGRFHFNTNAIYYVKLVGDLSWNLTFYGSWDNRPPPTLSGSDYGSSSGLSWVFGNR